MSKTSLHPARRLGTHERFIDFLIEHYAGNFPLWLSPEQVRVLPIGNEPALVDYAHAIQTELRASGVRCDLDASNDHVKAKIANAEQMKVHTMLVIGNRDPEANAVSVRVHGQGPSAPCHATKLSLGSCATLVNAFSSERATPR